MVRRSALLLALLLVPGILLAQGGEQPPVDPEDYLSPSGRFVLHVEPGHRDGKGPAQYHLSEAGERRWAGERPFTLFDARVGDDGLVAGYAYTSGLYTGFRPAGDLRVVVLGPTGRTRLDHAVPRQTSRVIHEDRGDPRVEGLLFDPEHDRLVVRATRAEHDGEVWWPYRLSTGEILPRIVPRDLQPPSELQVRIDDAQPVAGTAWTLVAWLCLDYDQARQGARFTLLDAALRPVWTLDLLDDEIGRAGSEKPVARHARERGRILETGLRSFTLLHVRSEQALSFSIDAETGQVVATGRHPFLLPVPQAPWVAGLPEQPTRYLGSVPLRGPEASPLLRGVRDFEVDGQGRFGFLRRDPEGTRFLLLDSEGALLREMGLDADDPGAESEIHLAWCGGERWVATVRRGSPARSGAYWLDAESGVVRPLEGFTAQRVDALAGRPDGGFVIVEQRTTPHGLFSTIDRSLRAFDPEGQPLWAIEDDIGLSHDLAVAADGQVAVLETQGVTVFGPDGSVVAQLDLRASLGGDPGYLSSISGDSAGGWLVGASGSPGPFLRLSADGKLRAAITPRYRDGRSTGRLFRLRRDAQGGLWGTDGEALLRLDAAGVVDRVVGPPPSTRVLGEVAAVALDAADRIHAVDARTGSVHVLAPDGQLLRVLAVAPGEVDGPLSGPEITIALDGRVCVNLGDVVDPKHVCFGADGQQIAPLELSAGGRQTSWWFQAVAGHLWVAGWTDFLLADESGATLRRVEKRQDGRWLRQFVRLLPSADGGVAVTHGRGWSSEDWALDLYGPEALPRASFDMPATASPYGLTYDGRRVALWHEGALAVFDSMGQGSRLSPILAGRKLRDLPLFLAAGGRELWLFEASAAALHRFSLPASVPPSR